MQIARSITHNYAWCSRRSHQLKPTLGAFETKLQKEFRRVLLEVQVGCFSATGSGFILETLFLDLSNGQARRISA